MAAPAYHLDERLKEFATPRQVEFIDAVNLHKSIRAAARAMGLNMGSIQQAILSVRKKAAIMGYSPEHNLQHPVAPGQRLRGASLLYKKGEPEPLLTWVKSTTDDGAREAIMRAALGALCAEVSRAEPLPPPPDTRDSLCTVYTLTDSHVGAYCWHQEGGADWNLKIAERTLIGCFEKMIQASPHSRVGIVAQLGDFLHQDGILPVTPTHHFVLDSDGRFSKVIGVAVKVLRTVVNMALARHEKVIVIMAEGNHDITSSMWLRAMFAALYENEPRVEVIDSPLPYYVFQHGQTMLAWHHGHLKKNDQLPMLFAAQFPKVWGATTKRYAHTGHRHHVEEKEGSGMHVMQHTTLTARDAHAARGGWISDRAVTAVTYHDKFGKHSTATICPEMLDPA